MDGKTFESEFKPRLLEDWNRETVIWIQKYGVIMINGRSKTESVEMIRIQRLN